MTNQLNRQVDPWDERFAFLWYNDREIFHSTQDDLNRQAEALAQSGVTHVITFSCTHFRWSFLRWRDLLTETLAKWVKACHLHGITITEHHSATLTKNPLDDADVRHIGNTLRIRQSSFDSWPELLDDCRADPIIDGVPMSSMHQIDGRTGKRARSGYAGYVMCPNNPDYRKAYFKYLETLYQTGIDGIMTDDVQFFAERNSCACDVCRRLFHERTGYDLPISGADWQAWHGNDNDPSFVAWLNFRFRSVEDFHQAVKNHYVALGLHPLRPGYCSTVLSINPTAYALETVPDLDWVSIECCFSSIIRYSWPYWAIETAHRFAVGRRRGIPAGAYFYPDRSDTSIFTWALARSWGVLWQPIQEGGEMVKGLRETEQRLRQFEHRHADFFKEPKRIATIGIYESRPNRELYGQAHPRSLKSLLAWCHACYRSNVPFDLFQKEELPERLNAYRLVVLNEVAMLSDVELNAFKLFVEQGGTLLWVGKTGVKDEKVCDRDVNFLATFWGIEDFVCAGDEDSMKTSTVGRGKLVTLGINFGIHAVEGRLFNSDRWSIHDKKTLFTIDINELRKRFREITALLLGLLNNADLTVENAPDDMIVTAFEAPHANGIAVHIVNAAGTFDIPMDAPLSHSDPIPFPAITGAAPIRISIRKLSGLGGRKFTQAEYFDPHSDNSLKLHVIDSKENVAVDVPVKHIKEYGLITLL